MRTAIVLGFLLAVTTTTFGATGASVLYQVDGRQYDGFYISPAPRAPLVLLIHDWDGLTDYEIRRSTMLADLGYAVFAADLFGAGVRPTEIDERRRLTGELYRDREKMRSLMKGALKAAQDRGAAVGNAIAMGYCFGGAAVLELARSGADMKGFVSFHGGLETPEGQSYEATRGEILVFHGSADAAVPFDHFASLVKELESAGTTHEMITYSGADHAFTVFGGARYQEAADRKSWRRFVEFLADTLK
ncbi:MAG: dienelactone hydrolase family protein [Desulfomonilia bacterium]|nr:dienelactone hydrolase family protein [Desulfomonilia bacterium]